MNSKIICGDCLEVMAGMPENSVDTVITDPPYGLSNESMQSLSHRVFRGLLDVVFPNLHEWDSKLMEKVDLHGIPLGGSPLRLREIAAIVESRISVPVSPVDFDGKVEVGSKEVETSDVAPGVGTSDSVLMDGVNAEGDQFLGDFVLDFGNAAELASDDRCDGFMPELSSSGFCVPVSPVLFPGGDCSFTRLCLGLSPFGGDSVRLSDDALGVAKCAPLIMALRGAINTFMLRFDVRNGTLKLFTTHRASQRDPVAELYRPKLIRAGPATSSLPTDFEPVRVCLVGFGADGASPFYLHLWLHKDWVSKLNSIIPRGGFMGKSWDAVTPETEIWREVRRVLKPGGTALVFGGTRTFHHMMRSMEDAGWELRDTMMWLYGSGFPKSYNIGKGMDKKLPRIGMFEAFAEHFAEQREKSGLSQKDIAKHFPSKTGGLTGCAWNWENAANVPTREQWEVLQPMLDLSDAWLPLIKRIEAEREVIGQVTKGSSPLPNNHAGTWADGQEDGTFDITAPATPEAETWDGWGTALKPAWEPVIVAMNPREDTFVNNALKWGVSGIWIDGARVGTETITQHGRGDSENTCMSGRNYAEEAGRSWTGRWPANLLLQHSPGCEQRLKLKGSSNALPDFINFAIVKDTVNLDALPLKDSINRNVTGAKPGTIVVVRTIDLDDFLRFRQEEVNDKGPLWPFYDVLMDEVDSDLLKLRLDKQFGIRDSDNATLDSLSTIEGASSGSNATLEDTRAAWRTADMFTGRPLKSVGSYFKLLTTNGADKLNAVTCLTASEFIGALTRASRMLALPEFGVGNAVRGFTDGTDSIVPWHFVTSNRDYTTLLQSGQVVADWRCVESCPVRLLAEQSGESGGGQLTIAARQRKASWRRLEGRDDLPSDDGMAIDNYGDTGTAARFFQQFEGETRFYYCAKASRSERTCDGTVECDHPTVKPLSLIQYLCRLTKTPTGGVVLDPFMGSGTTGMACIEEGRDFIGIDKEESYCKIAKARIEWTKEQNKQLELDL